MRVAPLAILLTALALCGLVRAQDAAPPPEAPAQKPIGIELANAPADESDALNRLLDSKSWPLRAFAVMRLERYDCEGRVRSYAFACLARRGVVVPEDRLAAEIDPRVVRTILRGRYRLPQKSVDLRIERCEESMNLAEAM